MSSDASATRSLELDASFDAFVLSRSAALLHSAYLLLGDHGRSEDLLQLALLRMARRWDVAQHAPDAYARKVLVNLSRDQDRALRRRVRERALHDDDCWAPARDHADGVVRRDAVLDALRILPARQREVVVLRFFAELTIPETAVAIGCSQATVKSHTRRALARLRELLADDSTEIRW